MSISSSPDYVKCETPATRGPCAVGVPGGFAGTEEGSLTGKAAKSAKDGTADGWDSLIAAEQFLERVFDDGASFSECGLVDA